MKCLFYQTSLKHIKRKAYGLHYFDQKRVNFKIVFLVRREGQHYLEVLEIKSEMVRTCLEERQ